jgi:hypothetical protein
VVDDAETERRLRTGRGAWDAGRNEWEGEIPAEPKRQRIANGE